MLNIEKRITVTGAVNLESVNGAEPILCGAGIYSAISAAQTGGQVALAACVGAETQEKLINHLKRKFCDLPISFYIQKKKGPNFLHSIDTNTKEEIKEFGNYMNFIFEEAIIKTKFLLLGTATPLLQKSVLNCCSSYDFLAWDSKEIYYDTCIDELMFFLPLVNLYSGTNHEVDKMLERLSLTNVQDLFSIYPNIQYILYKMGAAGGRLYLRNGDIFEYKIRLDTMAVNECGAGDILLGSFIGLLNRFGENNINLVLRSAVKMATASTMFNGLNKLKRSNIETVDVYITKGR